MLKETPCFQASWTPKTRYFSFEELKSLEKGAIPHHVAIIMDGNRRWAKQQAATCSQQEGHWAGAKALTEIVAAAQELGIRVLTVWAFSTENWARPRAEIELLMHIFEVYLRDNREKMIEAGIRFHVIGDLSCMSDSFFQAIQQITQETQRGQALDLVIAFNYGGRDDIRRAVVRLIQDAKLNKLGINAIDEKCIGSYLDTAKWPDPDLLIRTSAESRVSNFLLWQIAYTELFTTEVLWPDFTPRELLQAVLEFQKRERRHGK